MIATGIVRRVDELGRVVLPKELRDTLRISERDPLEIFVEDNMLCMRKYSPLRNFTSDAKVMLNSFGVKPNVNIVITDTERVIASQISDYIDKPVSYAFAKVLATKKNQIECVVLTNSNKGNTGYIAPIISNGELIGSVAAVDSLKITDRDYAIIEFIASTLSKMNEQKN